MTPLGGLAQKQGKNCRLIDALPMITVIKLEASQQASGA